MKISKKDLYYYAVIMLSLIPLYRPRSFDLHAGITKILLYYQSLFIAIFFVFIFVTVLKMGLKTFSLISYLVIAYEFYQITCVYLNGMFDISIIISAGSIIASTMLTEYFLKVVPKAYLGILSLYTGILVFINNLSFFYIKSSDYTDATGNIVYFWSTKNHLSSLFFVAMLSTIIIHGMKRNFITWCWRIFVIANVFGGTILFNSSTNIIGILVFLIMYFLCKRKNLLYRPFLWLIGSIGLQIAIVLFRVQNVLAWIIEHWFNKTVSFANRTYIWDAALLNVYKSPIIGYGKSSIFKFSFARTEIPAHNQFLDIAIVCGIPGLVLFVMVLVVAFRNLGLQKESLVGRMLSCALLGCTIMMIVESPNPYQPWFMLFGMTSVVDELGKLYIGKVKVYSRNKEFWVKKM